MSRFARLREPQVRYGLLLATTITLVCVVGMIPTSGVQEVLVTALAGASLLLAFRAAALAHVAVIGALVVAGALLAVAVVRATAGGIGDGEANTMNAALVALGPPAVALGIVRDLHAAGRVRLQVVMGVLSLYMLIGMLFSFTYGAIDRFAAEPFFTNAVATPSHCLYYSFTTLTTVGYGDLVSGSDVGHTLSVLEALLGQIYLVTVVSMVVSNLVPERGRRRSYAVGTTPETEVPLPGSER